MGPTEPFTVASFLPRKRTLRKVPCPRLGAVLAGASLLLCLVPVRAPAQQQTAGPGVNGSSLPEALIANTIVPDELAGVAGTVLDLSGATFPSANVSLMRKDGTQLHTMVSEANGDFNFIKILPGSYLVIVNAKGFALFTSSEFVVTASQLYEVPVISFHRGVHRHRWPRCDTYCTWH
jgi:hypothetical protein